MAHVTYRIVEHDGGWAYQFGGTYSETFASHDSAKAAAVRAAREQKVPDQTAAIEYETANGQWVTESADGHDRPSTEVED
ncbi:MAG: hypothetical protein DI624_03340 [Brevundimonas sp.]|uniref:hypothetical protein n=1 Tax=Brevundimonas sp. TaxID=1871086 RepID=UPI000DB380F6|nr:hypothetical protein [Brevundimonas sp.]PZU00386.1 MAG: hypothetical protein DI624_03340 [Brevundimonas sp.]